MRVARNWVAEAGSPGMLSLSPSLPIGKSEEGGNERPTSGPFREGAEKTPGWALV